MIWKHLLCFSLLNLLFFCQVNAIDLLEILEAIPEEEWVEFLTYHIEKGAELYETTGTTVTVEPSVVETSDPTELVANKLSIEIYLYALTHCTEVTTDSGRSINICFENGECIDIGDVGIYP